MRVFVDCLVDGFTRGSDGFYRGNWDKVNSAVETIQGRARGPITVSAQRPGLLRLVWYDTRHDAEYVIVETALVATSLVDGVARIITIELD